ncbi:MAG: hypothetical protein AAF213_02100 [Pseudomonadota bacterium]
MTDQSSATDNTGSVLSSAIVLRLALLGSLAAGGAVYLASGQNSDHETMAVDATGQVRMIEPGSPDDIAFDAPVQTLGVGEPGDWRLGQQTRHVFQPDSKLRNELTIQAADVESGRYHYPGDLVIQGTLTQDYVEFTAASVTVTEGIEANHVRLLAEETGPERVEPEIIEFARGNHFTLAGWVHEYERGTIAVGGDVVGDDIDLVGSAIGITGDAQGDITLAASGGERSYVSVGNSRGITLENFSDWQREDIPFTEGSRLSMQHPDEAIHVAGMEGEGVTRMRTNHWFEARAEALASVEPAEPSAPAVATDGAVFQQPDTISRGRPFP